MLLSVLRGLVRRSRTNVPEPPRPAPSAAARSPAAQQLLERAFESYRSGALAEAEHALLEAYRLARGDLDVCLLLALVLRKQGRGREALELLRALRGGHADTFDLRHAIAATAAELGEDTLAVEAYEAALAVRAELPELHMALASSYEKLKRDAEAIAAYRQVLAMSPRYPGAHLNLGRLLQRGGQLHEAKACFESVLELNPQSAKGWFNLGVTLDQLGSPESAESHYRRAVELDPGFADAHVNLGVLLSRRGEFTAALVELERGGQAGLPAVHFNRAIALAHEGRIEEARGEFARARQIPLDALEWHNDIGIMFFIHGCVDEARALLEHAAALSNAPRTQYNLGLVRLAGGPSAQAWDQFAWRFHPDVAATFERKHPFRPWRGEDLAGRTLLVWGEQGVGDEILYAGMYPQLQHRGARVILECHRKLTGLLARSFPWLTVVGREPSPSSALEQGIDFQISAGGLARYLRSSLDMFPAHDGYLVADESRARYWKQRLAELGDGLKIGFSWRSINLKGERALACTALDEWGAVFAVPGVHWVCLQYDRCEDELAAARARFGVPLHRFEEIDYFDDLDEVAALMRGLDLVISAPTTVSVQSAALGIPTWQTTYGVDWQTHGTGRNPWLPAITRFERRWDQTWLQVHDDVAERLRAHTART